MKTPRRCCVRQKAGGMYIHLGLKAGLLRQLREIHSRVTYIDIQMNVDGIRAYNNSRAQVCPILSRIISPFLGQPLVIGLYCGKNKLNDAQQLMSDTVTELTDVLVNGVSGVYHIHTIRLLYGCLNRFSCFPYESELDHLKHYIHGPKPPALQLYRLLTERVELDAVEGGIFSDDVGLPLRPSATCGCHRFVHRGVVFSKNFPDNCILLDEQHEEGLLRGSKRKQYVHQSYYDGCSKKKQLPSDFTDKSEPGYSDIPIRQPQPVVTFALRTRHPSQVKPRYHVEQNLERIYSLLQGLHMKLDALVPTSGSQALTEPLLPLSSMEELRRYEEHLRDGPRYAQLVDATTEKFPNTNLRQIRGIVHRWLENERQKVRKRLQRATKNDKWCESCTQNPSLRIFAGNLGTRNIFPNPRLHVSWEDKRHIS
ncbi:hypothetical protein CLF_105381 [Clonorchis sinensis]|uniref:Uncharacterized protein n=1 Tax=Clonorchis sinensis TaxID=79923 RepID=G7YP83_CLOSI|nr:hypothetical protein CLF_105381 [Clonorchis sinensis]